MRNKGRVSIFRSGSTQLAIEPFLYAALARSNRKTAVANGTVKLIMAQFATGQATFVLALDNLNPHLSGGTVQGYVLMRAIILFVLNSAMLLTGCTPSVINKQIAQRTTNVKPSDSGFPNSVASLGPYEFVSVQGTGQIFTYNIASGSQVLVEPTYRTPCSDPSGMVVTSIGGSNVMAVVCYDTGYFLTLTVHANGSLSPLGSVGGLGTPYPGITLDGTDVFVPLFGVPLSANGGIAKVNIASPANPLITGVATLASPSPGEYANPGYLTAANGNIFVSAGSESAPQSDSSTIQVVDETTMELVGNPFPVAHSPQQLAVQGNVVYVTMFDAVQLESIDISDPTNLRLLQIFPLATGTGCHAEPVVVRNPYAYVGCYAEGTIEQVDITDPANMQLVQDVPGIDSPQRLKFDGGYLLVTSGASGGSVYQIPMSSFN
jgi:hypothetical protein